MHFSDGQVCDGLIIHVAAPDDDDGFIFDSLGDAGRVEQKGPAVWARFADLESYEVLEN